MLKNFPLVIDIILLVAFNIYLSIWPDWWPACAQEFEIFAPPRSDMTFRVLILAMVSANLVASLLCEMVLADIVINNISSGNEKKYEIFSRELTKRHDWPPVTIDLMEDLKLTDDLITNPDSKVVIESRRSIQTNEAMANILS